MRIFDWLFGRRPIARKTYVYKTLIKFVYRFNDKTWRCIFPSGDADDVTCEQLIKIALRELDVCSPVVNLSDPSLYHTWPGISDMRYMVEFLFDGSIAPDGFMGWSVTYSHPNPNGHISTGDRFEYGDTQAITAFLQEQLEVAQLAIVTKILSSE
jgi:hypothetical protein